jgi:hypothetical protein
LNCNREVINSSARSSPAGVGHFNIGTYPLDIRPGAVETNSYAHIRPDPHQFLCDPNEFLTGPLPRNPVFVFTPENIVQAEHNVVPVNHKNKLFVSVDCCTSRPAILLGRLLGLGAFFKQALFSLEGLVNASAIPLLKKGIIRDFLNQMLAAAEVMPGLGPVYDAKKVGGQLARRFRSGMIKANKANRTTWRISQKPCWFLSDVIPRVRPSPAPAFESVGSRKAARCGIARRRGRSSQSAPWRPHNVAAAFP